MAEQQAMEIGDDSKMEAEEMEQQASYVVHGAYAYCSMGARPARLVVPACHGTYMHDMPIMTIHDCVPKENVQIFGCCSSMENPDRDAEAARIQENVKKSGDLMNLVMDVFTTGIGGLIKKKKGNDLDEIKQQVMILCNPILAPSWQNGSRKLLIQGVPALNSTCTLECLKGGGTITIIDDGQENAASEQQSRVDFNKWSEGDPLPEPTQSNLEALNKNIEELEREVNRYHEPEEMEALEKELEAKKALQGQMAGTAAILNDIKLQEFYVGAYGEEAQNRWDTLQETKNTVMDAYRNGNSLGAVDTHTTAELAEKTEYGSNMEALSTEKNLYLNGEIISEKELAETMFTEETEESDGWEKGEQRCQQDTKIC